MEQYIKISEGVEGEPKLDSCEVHSFELELQRDSIMTEKCCVNLIQQQPWVLRHLDLTTTQHCGSKYQSPTSFKKIKETQSSPNQRRKP